MPGLKAHSPAPVNQQPLALETAIDRLRRAISVPLPKQATADDRRRHARLCVEAVIVAIEAGHVAMGEWEGDAALSALAALAGGYSNMAVDFARRALLPERQRPARVHPMPMTKIDTLREVFTRTA